MKTILGAGITVVLVVCLGLLLVPIGVMLLVGLGVPLLMAGLVLCLVFSGVFAMVFWLWMLVDAIRNRGLSDGEKIGWVIAIAILHVLAAIAYFIFGHPKSKTPLPA